MRTHERNMMTPAQYAKQLAIKAITMPENSNAPRY